MPRSRVALPLTAVAAVVLLLAAAGCGADERAPVGVGLRAVAGQPAPDAEEVLVRFVEAARRGDAVELWGLLSGPARGSLGPTLDRFRLGAAWELRKAAGSFTDGAEVVLARSLGPRWAVAAVAGEVDREGEREPAAFAVALRREGGSWRVELNGLWFVGHRPAPLAELGSDGEPLLQVTAQSSARIESMVVWLDGQPAGARAVRPQPFTGTIVARSGAPLDPGVHVVTVFAATEETAAAQAWPFEVGG